MLSGQITKNLIVTGGLTALDPRLNDTGIPATNDKVFVGIPHYKSNILSEYHLPVSIPVFLHFDWQHVGRRAIDPMNTSYTPQYNIFDVGFRYSTKIMGKETSWRVTANNISNVHYWSTIGMTDIVGNPGGSETGQTVAPGSTQSYLGHLGEPRLITASVRFNF